MPTDTFLGELKTTLALHYACPVGLCLGSSNSIGGALTNQVQQMQCIVAVASHLAIHQHHVLQTDDGEVDLVLVVVVIGQVEGLVAVSLALGSSLEELGIERLARITRTGSGVHEVIAGEEADGPVGTLVLVVVALRTEARCAIVTIHLNDVGSCVELIAKDTHGIEGIAAHLRLHLEDGIVAQGLGSIGGILELPDEVLVVVLMEEHACPLLGISSPVTGWSTRSVALADAGIGKHLGKLTLGKLLVAVAAIYVGMGSHGEIDAAQHSLGSNLGGLTGHGIATEVGRSIVEQCLGLLKVTDDQLIHFGRSALTQRQCLIEAQRVVEDGDVTEETYEVEIAVGTDEISFAEHLVLDSLTGESCDGGHLLKESVGMSDGLIVIGPGSIEFVECGDVMVMHAEGGPGALGIPFAVGLVRRDVGQIIGVVGHGHQVVIDTVETLFGLIGRAPERVGGQRVRRSHVKVIFTGSQAEDCCKRQSQQIFFHNDIFFILN